MEKRKERGTMESGRIVFNRLQIVRDFGRSGRFLDQAAGVAREKNHFEIALVAFALARTEDQVRIEGNPSSYDRLAILREIARAPQFLDQAVEILQSKIPPGMQRYVTDFDIGRVALALAFNTDEEKVVQKILNEIINWVGYQTSLEIGVSRADETERGE
jgi:hypothetical protein